MLSIFFTTATKRAGSAVVQQRAILNEIREYYLDTVVGVRSRFLSNLTMPPAEFINQELERKGESWRVQNVAGAGWDIREIQAQ